ncbi:MAG: PAS domain-containing protein [Herpetosiphonaceae bacterium]|nr:PAS domain-containing protein [Herpetosiphonaceae bacterium]
MYVDESSQLARLHQFLSWIVPCNLAFGIIEAVAFAVFHDLATGISTAVLLGGSVVLMRARVLVRRGRLKDAIVTICATLLGASVLIVLLQPALQATLACIPLLAVALALPYLSGRALRVLIASALATTVVVVCCGELMPSASHLPAWFVATFHTSSLTATIALVLLLLWQFSSRLTATLGRTQAAEERYSLAAQGANDGLWDWDLRSDEVYYSPRWKEMLGSTEGDIGTSPEEWFCRIHPADCARVRTEIAAHREGLTHHFESELRMIDASGHYRWILSRGLAVRDADGRALRIAGSQTDMTGRKQVEEALRDSEERFRQVTEHVREVFWMREVSSGLLIYVSPAYEELWGRKCSAPSVALEAWLAAIHSDDRARVEQAMQTKQTTGTYDEEYRILHSDGTLLWIKDRAFPVQDAAGQVYRVVGIAEDITGPRQIAEALNVAKDAAEAANLAKSEFLATMSHEIRTPMNGVIAMIEMLLATQLTAKQREYADIIRLSGDGLLRLINDILDFSRIEAGKLDLDVDTFDPRGLLDEVTSMTRSRALNQGLKLRTSVDSSVPAQLCGDGYRLRQVLLNLVSNAVKFTEQGTVDIEASVDRTDGQQVWIHFAVRDTGVGLGPVARVQLFQPFTQADSSMARKHGGTGLGLAISQRLIELMGGVIEVASVEGEGSTFTCRVPFAYAKGLIPSVPTGDLTGIVTLPQVQVDPGVMILVVEDNPVNQRITRMQLEKLGYGVDVASNGREALRVLAEAQGTTPWGLVLMDCQMPEMDGFEATAAIRATEHSTGLHLPIVALTANALLGDVARCLRAGMDDYLAKPVGLDELRATIERWVAASAPRRDPAPAPQYLMPKAATLDHAMLNELRGLQEEGMPDLLSELVDLFMDEAPRLITAIRAAITMGDAGALRVAAHTLKGCSSNLGALVLAGECKKLEDLGRGGALGDAPRGFEAVEMEYARAATALRQERATLTSDA